MRHKSLRNPCIIIALLAIPLATAQTIILRDGQTIHADVLRETADRVIVDLGFDVLSIPRNHVREVRTLEQTEAAEGKVRQTDDLYSVADLPPRSVKELTEEFGEGVVLVSVPNALGSGFFISKQGHVITNFHVIEGETKIAVTIFRRGEAEFRRDKYEDVEIVATNPFLDVALLKVNLPESYEPVITYFANEEDLRDGDRTFAIGNPLGLVRSVSEGIVSKRNRVFEGIAYIQTDTPINPGNSGGPLFNTRGEVVGVTNMGIPLGENLGFAIPIRYVIDFLHNREAFAYNSESSEAGYRYLQPPARQDPTPPKLDIDKED